MWVRPCQEQTSILAEWAWQEEYDKVWEIPLQGLYYMTRVEKDDRCDCIGKSLTHVVLNTATSRCLGCAWEVQDDCKHSLGFVNLVQSSCKVRSLLVIYLNKLIAWARQNCIKAENGQNKEVNPNLLWIGRMERRLHAIMARVEQKICINFAQLYLHNG